MTIISANLFKALKQAGVPEDLAEKASSEVAESTKKVLEQNNKLDKLDARIDKIESKLNILLTINIAVLASFMATLFAAVFNLFFK